jgi:DNA-binding transcriptional ArsR family regulator
MGAGLHIAEVANLVGDPARANILAALLDQRALTASELAYAAGVSAQTTSSHLGKLAQTHLLEVEKQGRHRYYRLASPLVAQMLESVMAVSAHGPRRGRPVARCDEGLRTARTCYDHLAGRLGVGLADALTQRGIIALDHDGGEVTATGLTFFSELGVDLTAPAKSRRVFCRPLPRLDGTPLPSRRPCRRLPSAPLPRPRLDHAPARQPRCNDHAGRREADAGDSWSCFG